MDQFFSKSVTPAISSVCLGLCVDSLLRVEFDSFIHLMQCATKNREHTSTGLGISWPIVRQKDNVDEHEIEHWAGYTFWRSSSLSGGESAFTVAEVEGVCEWWKSNSGIP